MPNTFRHIQRIRIVVIILLAGSAILTAQIAPPPDPNLTITTIEGPNEGSHGTSFAAGDGTLWVYANDSLYKAVPQNDQMAAIAAERLKGRVVDGFAYGAGYAWIIKSDEPGIHRMDANSGKLIDTILAERKKLGSLVYWHKSLWVYDQSDWLSHRGVWLRRDNPTATLLRIDPKNGQVVEIDLGKGLWVEPPKFDDDAAWVIETLKGTIKKIDLQSNKVVDEFSASNAQQGGAYMFTLGAGSLWVGNQYGRKYLLSHFDIKTHELIARIEINDSQGAPVFWNGYVWISTYGSHMEGHFITKVNPKTNHVANQVFLPVNKGRFFCRGSMPARLVADDDSLWAVNPGSCGGTAPVAIYRIQAKSGLDK